MKSLAYCFTSFQVTETVHALSAQGHVIFFKGLECAITDLRYVSKHPLHMLAFWSHSSRRGKLSAAWKSEQTAHSCRVELIAASERGRVEGSAGNSTVLLGRLRGSFCAAVYGYVSGVMNGRDSEPRIPSRRQSGLVRSVLPWMYEHLHPPPVPSGFSILSSPCGFPQVAP